MYTHFLEFSRVTSADRSSRTTANSNNTVLPAPVGALQRYYSSSFHFLRPAIPLITCAETRSGYQGHYSMGVAPYWSEYLRPTYSVSSTGTYILCLLAVSKHCDCIALNAVNLNTSWHQSAKRLDSAVALICECAYARKEDTGIRLSGGKHDAPCV